MATTAKDTTKTVYRVTRDQLPLSCPSVQDDVYELHPRVYLPIEKTGEATCPYCGARSQLED